MATGTSSSICAFPRWQGQKRQHILLLRHKGEVPREHHVRKIKINSNTEQNLSLKEWDDLKLLVIKGETVLHTALLQPRSTPDFQCSAYSTVFCVFFFCKNTQWILLPFLDINMQPIINCELRHWIISLQECQAGSVLDQPMWQRSNSQRLGHFSETICTQQLSREARANPILGPARDAEF